MLDDLSTSLTILRSVLIIVGVCAIAVWAVRQPDTLSELTQRRSERDTKHIKKNEPA